MTAIRAHWNQGRVVLDEPVELAEGSRLIVMPADETGLLGMTEEEQRDDVESIARWIADCDAIPPLDMFPPGRIRHAIMAATHEWPQHRDSSRAVGWQCLTC